MLPIKTSFYERNWALFRNNERNKYYINTVIFKKCMKNIYLIYHVIYCLLLRVFEFYVLFYQKRDIGIYCTKTI